MKLDFLILPMRKLRHKEAGTLSKMTVSEVRLECKAFKCSVKAFKGISLSTKYLGKE